MKSSMKSYFRRLAEGYEGGFMSQCLKPFLGVAEQAYGVGVKGMKQLYDQKVFKRNKLPFPVISVGNITWGGTGKTPLVEYLARRVSDQQKTPLILTRGYSHDEVAQMKQHLPNVRVGAGKNRSEVAGKIAKEQKIDLAILDDGLQHWPIERDMDVVMVNALNPFGNGRLIPQGILREPVSALERASVIMISHVNLIGPEELKKLKEQLRKLSPKAALMESYLEPLFFYRAKNRDRVMLPKLEKQKVCTFCGVGAPVSFQKLLAKLGLKTVLNYEFTDHHDFTEKELLEIKTAAAAKGISEIITTEKDLYRSPQLITQVLNPLVLATRFRIRSGEELLNEKIFKLMGAVRS